MVHLDFCTLDAMRARHPAWRRLRSDHAALIASFLHRAGPPALLRACPAAAGNMRDRSAGWDAGCRQL
jgi:hypothetical protein